MKLVLFDIDGTLITSEGVGRASMRRALGEVFGSPGSEAYRYDGKTDKQIAREVMQLEGHSDATIDERMELVMRRYVTGLEEGIATGQYNVRPLPGVLELLDALEKRDDVVLGLLTGNIVEGAKRKLGAAGLRMERFRVNAFGSDHENRPNLPVIAQQRAREMLGLDLGGGQLIVIGDTPADIECCRSLGAKAIAVATGRYSVDDLRAHEPYAVFETLAETPRIVETIVNA